jgi:O-antigen/teichoic acid export membrane protein
MSTAPEQAPHAAADRAGHASQLNWAIVFRNVFSNWASYAVVAAVGFLLTPFVVHSLGQAGYGLWTLLLSLTGYFGLLDLGIRSSLGRFVARYVAMKDAERVSRTVSTAVAMLGLGGLLAFGSSIVIAQFFLDGFKIGAEQLSTAKAALIIAGLNMSCALPLAVFTAVLIGLERFDVLSGITMVGALVRAALVVAVLKSGYGLVALAAVTLAEALAEYCAMAFAAKLLFPALRLSLRLVDRATFFELFGFSVYRFIWMAGTQLIFYSNSLVIGAFLGTAAITTYAIACSVINYGRIFVSLLTDTFYPAATRMDARNDVKGLQELLFQGTRIALMVALPLFIGYIFLGRQFITVWMGKSYATSAIYLSVLAVAQLTFMSQNVSTLILAGMARHRILAYLILAEGIVVIIVSIFLVRRMGLMGVALGTVIPDVISTAVVIPLYTLRLLGISPGRYWKQTFLGPLAAAVPAAGLAWLFSSIVSEPGWLGFGAEVLAVCAIFAAAAYFVCLNAGQRLYIQRRLCSAFSREPVRHET